MFVTGDKMSLLHKRFIRAWRQSKKLKLKKIKIQHFDFRVSHHLCSFIRIVNEKFIQKQEEFIIYLEERTKNLFFSNQTVTLFSTRNIISHFSQYQFEIETQRGENFFFFF
jgi:hypothetical protein